MTYSEKQLMEDIYDLIKVNALSSGQNDVWAELSRKHAIDAKKGIHAYLKNKRIEWDGEKNTITIGQHIIIYLTDLRKVQP